TIGVPPALDLISMGNARLFMKTKELPSKHASIGTASGIEYLTVELWHSAGSGVATASADPTTAEAGSRTQTARIETNDLRVRDTFNMSTSTGCSELSTSWPPP